MRVLMVSVIANPGKCLGRSLPDKINRWAINEKKFSASAMLRDKLANPRTRVEAMQGHDPLKALEPGHAKELLAMRIPFEPKLARELIRIAHPSETARKR